MRQLSKHPDGPAALGEGTPSLGAMGGSWELLTTVLRDRVPQRPYPSGREVRPPP